MYKKDVKKIKTSLEFLMKIVKLIGIILYN